MKVKSCLALSLVLMFAASVYSQESAAESLEKLRAQLAEVQTKEEALRARAEQLDESLKPENIERSLAGVGSTKPEELREARRRQLTVEKDGVSNQLKLLETSRQRLETAIANAEARAYQESARGPATQMMSAAGWNPWFMYGGGGFAALAVAAAGVLIYRRKIRLR